MIRDRDSKREKITMNNIQDIFAYLDLQRNREELRRKDWTEKLYQAHPDIRDLENRKRKIILDRLKEVMESPLEKDTIISKSETEIGEIDRQLNELRDMYSVEPYRNKYICDKCNGTGYCNGALCTCVRAKAYKELFGARTASDIKTSYAHFDKHLFDEQDQLDESEATRLFLEDYASHYDKNDKKIIVFSGPPGLGKTYHMESLLKILSEKEEDICLISSYRLFDAFHKDRLGELEDLRIIYDSKILAIDDLGSEPMTQNVTREYLFDMLTYRMEKGTYTFFATNNDIKQLQDRYSGRVVSRMIGSDSIYLTFEGKDLRIRGF